MAVANCDFTNQTVRTYDTQQLHFSLGQLMMHVYPYRVASTELDFNKPCCYIDIVVQLKKTGKYYCLGVHLVAASVPECFTSANQNSSLS